MAKAVTRTNEIPIGLFCQPALRSLFRGAFVTCLFRRGASGNLRMLVAVRGFKVWVVHVSSHRHVVASTSSALEPAPASKEFVLLRVYRSLKAISSCYNSHLALVRRRVDALLTFSSTPFPTDGRAQWRVSTRMHGVCVRYWMKYEPAAQLCPRAPDLVYAASRRVRALCGNAGRIVRCQVAGDCYYHLRTLIWTSYLGHPRTTDKIF
eukprot:3637492-Pleurochrysis_carterae.AAC.1